jgi:hypothetical protein
MESERKPSHLFDYWIHFGTFSNSLARLAQYHTSRRVQGPMLKRLGFSGDFQACFNLPNAIGLNFWEISNRTSLVLMEEMGQWTLTNVSNRLGDG